MPKLSFWLVVKGSSSIYSGTYPTSSPYSGQKVIDRVSARRVVVNKPECASDEIAFKVDIDIDASWFLEGTATISASVPAAPTANQNVPAKIDMPVKGRAKSAASKVIQP